MAKKSDIREQGVSDRLEQVLDQVGDTVQKIYEPVKRIDFKKDLDDSAIETLRIHLGYAKSYSDLAKTRLAYKQAAELLPDEEDTSA